MVTFCAFIYLENKKNYISNLYSSGPHHSNLENVGIVKGIPQVRNNPLEVKEHQNSPKKSSICGSDISDPPSQRIAPPYKDPPAPPPYRDPPPPNAASQRRNFQVSY